MSKFGQAIKPDVFHPKYGGKFGIYGSSPIIPIFNMNNIWFDHIKKVHYVDKNDIIVASNQKNGTHWLKRILLEIMKHSSSTKNVERYNTINLTAEMPCIEATDVFFTPDWTQDNGKGYENWINITNDGYPRIYHTHFHYENFAEFNINPAAKIISLCRNPKDVAISLYLMNQEITLGGSQQNKSMKGIEIDDNKDNYNYNDNEELEHFLYLFLSGLTTIGDHWDHILFWHLNKSDILNGNELLYVYYEDLLIDPLNTIKRIAKYIEKDDELNEEDYIDIINKTLFKNMKCEYILNPGNIYERLSLFPDKFFRTGINENWKNYFTDTMTHFYDCKTRIKFNQIPYIKYYQQLNN